MYENVMDKGSESAIYNTICSFYQCSIASAHKGTPVQINVMSLETARITRTEEEEKNFNLNPV